MKYRKKPVVIEAARWIEGNEEEVKRFINMELATEYQGELLIIETLEGTMRASQGDYIIKGINGEFYPCKPDIFEATYEIVEDDVELIHTVACRFGFTTEQAQIMMSNKKIKAFLISCMDLNGQNNLDTNVNFTIRGPGGNIVSRRC